MEQKILELYNLAGSIPFIEYYSHTNCDMYKILNPYTNYGEDKIVLHPVSEGLQKSIDKAIRVISERKQHFLHL